LAKLGNKKGEMGLKYPRVWIGKEAIFQLKEK
jgi:hypothetical protein